MSENTERLVSISVASDALCSSFERAQLPTLLFDRFERLNDFTPSAAAILRLTPEDRGRPLTEVSTDVEDADVLSAVRAATKSREIVELPARVSARDASYLLRIAPLSTEQGQADGTALSFIDVTPIVHSRSQERVLIAELNHRVRNMLQVVVGLARQTLHRSEDLQQFEKAFFGRMQALARAYELLSRDGWHKVPISDLLNAQLSPFMTEGGRFSSDGERLLLTANAALSLGLVLYEFATNSTKYGALSVPTGHVHVSWRIELRSDDELQFILRWQESGGPAVKPPTRHGFGSELVHRQLKYELDGNATMDFAESGLIITLVIPARDAVETVEASAAAGERR